MNDVVQNAPGPSGTVHAAGVSIKDLRKSYGSNEVLKGIDLEVAPGEVVCLIGPSGSGKSTLLRCVNLLEQPNQGTIHVGGFESTDPDVDIDRMRRKVGMVFQQFNLFPHLSALQNCTIAQTKVLKRNQADASAAAMKNLARVGLEHLADRFPDQLSGGCSPGRRRPGMRQRWAGLIRRPSRYGRQGSAGSSATTRSMRIRTARMMRWSASDPPRCISATAHGPS